MGRKRSYSDEQLRSAVAASTSVTEVLRRLGIKVAGGSHFHISKRIKRAGFDTSHFLGKASTRGRKFDRLTPEEILVRRDPALPRVKPRLLRRALQESGRNTECSKCGVTASWMGEHLTLHIDHIDGDPWNNEIENLRYLCPNCHSQTSTYCRQVASRSTAASALD